MSAYGDLNPGVAGLIVTQYPKIDSGIVQEAMTPGTPVFGYANFGNKVWKLKADVSMTQLSEELATTENRIAFARQAYNDQVLDYNHRAGRFPDLLLARLMGFAHLDMLQATEGAHERQVPQVRF